MNEPIKQPIDPRKLAANAKVVIQPAPTPAKKVTLPAGKLQGLGSLPKPTQNPPAKPEQFQQSHGQIVIQGPSTQQKLAEALVDKAVKGDMKATEMLAEKDLIIPPAQKNVENVEVRDDKGRFAEGHTPTGHRHKKKESSDFLLDAELDKAHGKLPDGSIITKRQFLAKTLTDKALDGNLKAIEIVFNRTDGKPMQKIQVIPPEDAAGTVVSKEDEERLEEMFGR